MDAARRGWTRRQCPFLSSSLSFLPRPVGSWPSRVWASAMTELCGKPSAVPQTSTMNGDSAAWPRCVAMNSASTAKVVWMNRFNARQDTPPLGRSKEIFAPVLATG